MPVEYDEELVNDLRQMFQALENPVSIKWFVDPGSECVYCDDTEQILNLVQQVSGGKVRVTRYTSKDPEAKKYSIDMFPAILIHGVDEWNVRFFGIPAGYEFGAFVEDIIDASTGRVNISPEIREILLKYVTKPTRIMIFVTPTCPYCPIAVRAAHRFAMVNKNIYGDMIEALEFSDLADRYGVYAVPKNVIQVNGEDKNEFEGAAPDPYFVAKILEAYGVEIPRSLQEAIAGIEAQYTEETYEDEELHHHHHHHH
ncbi:protein disulfide oxidoreductase [Thermofilum pendens]|uniref:Glutaredoxin-like domain protein n=1 Tax=Thermofilum pendens (strain DSM 2475 / Hrk 5) TaxID=368408 RepID=A1RX05_THEPD|nr:thioredoxin family protein [Thermofilum pendens]ABL77735.1 Glutaredoxin-like domain protein [Thermofilum pendens Hrk 5]